MTLTRSEIDAYRARWRLVDQVEVGELRSTPIAIKFQQLVALTSAVHSFDWRATSDADVDAIRSRWQLLRQALGG